MAVRENVFGADNDDELDNHELDNDELVDDELDDHELDNDELVDDELDMANHLEERDKLHVGGERKDVV